MIKARVLALTAACLCLLLSGCGKKEEAGAGSETVGSGIPFNPSAGTATITGKVIFEGKAPEMPEINISSDPVCVSLHNGPVRSEEIVVNGGHLANVFVYVKEGLEKYSFRPPSAPAELAQDGCQYKPHVSGIMVGQELKIANNDPTIHNVHCWANNNPSFNLSQPLKGMETTRTFSQPEIMVQFKCDVHKWMTAYFGVLPHPYYAVTGKDGTFALKNLPPGDYTIEAWQEKLGTQTLKVSVGDGGTKEISFSYKPVS